MGLALKPATPSQVTPPSVERNTVGPRWPARAAQSSVFPSRGSSTTWLTMCPRKCGPASVHFRLARSERTKNAPLRVPTSSVTGLEAGRRVFLLLDFFGIDVSLSLQSFDPPLVEAHGDLVERAHALLQPLEQLLGGLHRRSGLGDEL